MFSWDLTQGRPGHSAVSSLQSSHPSQHNVDLQRPREELGDSSDISPQLSCLAASQVGLVVARTDQQQLVCLMLPDVWPVMSDVCRMLPECRMCVGLGRSVSREVRSVSCEARSVSREVRSVSCEVRSVSCEVRSMSLLSVPLLSGHQPGGTGDG